MYLCTGAAAGLLLLFLAYCLPTEPMEAHVYQSLPMVVREFERQELVEGYPASFMGGFTDCLMLENAVYHSGEHSRLEQMLCMYRGESGTGDGWAAGYSLVDYLEGVKQPREESYARYWHGYLVVLKPLLFLTTFNSVRVLSAGMLFLLVGGIVLACCRRREFFLGLSFLLSVPFLYFFGLYASLSLSICFYLMGLALLIQLRWDETLRGKKWYGLFFLATGMATAYFDFLTYPLVTLGFPLCVCLYLGRENVEKSFKALVVNSAEWGIGYAGLWGLKWVIADVITGSGTIQDAVSTVLMRTDAAEGSFLNGFVQVVEENISVYKNWGFLPVIAGIVVMAARKLWRSRKKVRKTSLGRGMVILAVAVYPFLWFMAAQNHSEEHWIFTCKILAVTVFATLCALGTICGEDERER